VAETIDAFTKIDRRQASKFDVWLDGQKWRLSRDEDCENLDSLRRNLYRRGKTLGKRVVIAVHPHRGYLEVQALAPGRRANG
jgi:hypothetical protein